MADNQKTQTEVSCRMSKCILDTLFYALFLIPAELVRFLSLKNAYRFAKVMAFLFLLFDRKHKKRIITHLLHSGIVATKKDALILAKKNAFHMMKVFVEIIKFDQIITKENVHEYISIDPEYSEEVKKALSPEHHIPLIVASMHLGNWELSANCYCYIVEQAVCSIMRPLDNERIGNYFYAKRTGIDHETVDRNKGIKPLLMALRNGKTIAIVADQHANHTEGIEVEFFGHPARTHMTPALLHLKTGVPLIATVLVRLDDDFHFMLTGGDIIRYTPTGDKEKDIRAVTENFSATFEKLVRKYPDQWLWAHRRWLDCGRRGTWTQDHFDSIKNNQTAENDK